MRFIDEATITLRAGKGGAGCVSFRREKFIPLGGPNGGNGGDGGSIILRASIKLHSLYDFRLQRNYLADNGRPGLGSQKHGKKAEDLIIDFPVGTQIYLINEHGCEELYADISEENSEIIAVQGGRGGKGNEFFKSATRQAPRFAQPGEEGESIKVRLELKIIADCGLLGLPNAGKSTFISKVSAAKPKIAAYPFTTLVPNLGVMLHHDDYNARMIIADIPGLIEGAHAGVGLGHKFLKHVERTRFLVHILSAEDIDVEDKNPWAGFDLINEELKLFNDELAERRQIEVVNKIDLLSAEKLKKMLELAQQDGRKIYFISALKGESAALNAESAVIRQDDLEELSECMWSLQEELDMHAPFEIFRTYFVEEVEESEEVEEEVEEESEEAADFSTEALVEVTEKK